MRDDRSGISTRFFTDPMDSLKLYSPYVFHFELPFKKAVNHFFCIFVPLITGFGKIQESKVLTSIVNFLVQDLAFQALDFQLVVVCFFCLI